MIRLRNGDCGFLKTRNGILCAILSLGTWRRPVRFRNGRLSTGLLFGCGHKRGGGCARLDLFEAFREAFVEVDGIRRFGAAMMSKIRLNSSGCSSKR